MLIQGCSRYELLRIICGLELAPTDVYQYEVIAHDARRYVHTLFLSSPFQQFLIQHFGHVHHASHHPFPIQAISSLLRYQSSPHSVRNKLSTMLPYASHPNYLLEISQE